MSRPEPAGEEDAARRPRISAIELVLWAGMPVMAGLSFVWFGPSFSDAEGCRGAGSAEVVALAYDLFPRTLAIVFGGSLLAGVILWLRRKRSIWAATAGTLLTAVIVIGTAVITASCR